MLYFNNERRKNGKIFVKHFTKQNKKDRYLRVIENNKNLLIVHKFYMFPLNVLLLKKKL